MEFPAVHWRMPSYGSIKVNVQGFFSEEALPMATNLVLRLYGGSLGIEERRTNELYAIL